VPGGGEGDDEDEEEGGATNVVEEVVWKWQEKDSHLWVKGMTGTYENLLVRSIQTGGKVAVLQLPVS
jgi:hypothetical protein